MATINPPRRRHWNSFAALLVLYTGLIYEANIFLNIQQGHPFPRHLQTTIGPLLGHAFGIRKRLTAWTHEVRERLWSEKEKTAGAGWDYRFYLKARRVPEKRLGALPFTAKPGLGIGVASDVDGRNSSSQKTQETRPMDPWT